MTNFQKVKSIISTYQENADRHFANYKAKEAAMRKRYSQESFVEEFIQGVYPKFAGEAQANADIAIKEIEEVFGDIETDLKKYIMEPLDDSTAQILDCVNRFDLKMSRGELEVIESAVKKSYLGSRVFEGIARKNGYHVDVPKMEQFQHALKSARNNAALSIRAYAGSPDSKFVGRDLLPKWEKDGVVLGNYEVFHTLYAYQYLEKGEIDRLEKMFSDARAASVYRLTEEEEKNVRQGVESILHNGEIDKKAAQALIKKEPDFKDKLESMPADYFDDKEAVIKYFGLNEKAEGKEPSMIDVATKKAIEYGKTGKQTINPQTLSNFA